MSSQGLDGLRSADPVRINVSESKLARAVLCFVAAHLLLWTILPLLLGGEVPIDNVELLNWGVHPAWGYEKHPPVPAWIIYAFTRVLPATIPTTYVLGALQIAMMLYAAWLLGRELLGVREAHVSVLLITCITFYANRMHFFNHNTALLVATAGAVYCLWQAVQSGKQLWWLALGLCWGIGLLSKYQMVVTIACNLAFLWTQRSANTAPLVRGVALASAVCAAFLVPHLTWVLTHDLPTVYYASKYVGVDHSAVARVSRVISFSADQFLRFAPLLLFLIVQRPIANAFGEPDESNGHSPPQHPKQVRQFLAIHAWGPLVIMNLLGLLIGLRLGMQWGTAFLWMLPLWFVATRSGQKIVRTNVRPIFISLVFAQAVMVLAFVLDL